MSSKQVPFESEAKELEVTDNVEKQTNDAISKMKSHLDEISKLMENIQINTNSIDDEVLKCEDIINDTFNEISNALNKRKESLINELRKTAKNKKLSLLLQHNELNNKYQESQNKINIHDETIQNQSNSSLKDVDSDNIIESIQNASSPKAVISTNFDLHFNSNHSKQLIQMINHFGSISANPVPNLLSLKNNGKNFVICVQWKLPSSYIATIDRNKIQKIRIEWSNTLELKWNHKEFVISDDDKKENQREEGRINLINVGCNGTYIFRVRHYYLNKWSKMSNTKSISLNGISFDYWDNKYHGINIQIEGKCILKRNKTGYESAFLSNIAKMRDDDMSNIFEWKFKIEGGHKSGGSTRIFGIWRVDENKQDDDDMKLINDNMKKITNTYFTNEKLIDNDNDNNKESVCYGKPFGDKCHDGDTIDMILDLNQLKLFYKLNNEIYGKPIDIAPANYKAVVSFYYLDDRIKLLQFTTN